MVAVPANAWEDEVKIGESVAVNGCCLTAVAVGERLEFDLSEETLRRTALGGVEPGMKLNLERALRPIDRMGGHFVQGHVDGVGQLLSRTPAEAGEVFRFQVPEEGSRYLIDKGSIALDGISLTIVKPQGSEFEVWVIPHTLAETNLQTLLPGARVNVEFDMVAKHIVALSGGAGIPPPE